VWFDALTNYITAAGYADDPERFGRIWPADVHLIGKDILRQHAIYWPAMLMSAGIEPPLQVWAHGFLTVGGQKMGKSNATGIHPFDLLDQFGVDGYRYCFLRDIQFGQDGNFSWESMAARYTADLANGLGNLASRVLAMVDGNFDGLVPEPADRGAGQLPASAAELARRFDERILNLDLTGAATALSDFVGEMNRFLVETSPWKLAKDQARRADVAAILYESLEALRIIAVISSPIMPRASAGLWAQLGLAGSPEEQRLPAAAAWGSLEPGTAIRRGESLFPRLDG
jgi:methionyl-tRNA synthetase